jgi:hypothetical protein
MSSGEVSGCRSFGAAANRQKVAVRRGGEMAVARALAVGGGPKGEAGGGCERGDIGEEAMLDLDSGDGRHGGRCDHEIGQSLRMLLASIEHCKSPL